MFSAKGALAFDCVQSTAAAWKIALAPAAGLATTTAGRADASQFP